MQGKSEFSKWAMLIYFIMAIYYFGFVIATYYITYPHFDKVHDHWQEYTTLFNNKTFIWLTIPAILLVLSAISLLLFSSKTFPKWAIGASVGLVAVSVTTTFFVVLPIYHALPSSGFNPETHQKLLTGSLYFQVIPAGIACLPILWMLNRYLQYTKLASRWIFIGVFVLTIYLVGTNTVEALIEYPLWNTVSETDWLPFRRSVPSVAFFLVYLIPGWLPFLLIIPMIWLRPKGIPKVLPILYLLFSTWAFYITATYFVPDAQMPLDEAYSKSLLEDLVKNDQLKRFWIMYVHLALVAFMFMKSEQKKY